MANVQIEVLGLKELEAKLKRLGKSLSTYAQAAAVEASKDLLKHEGLQKYPPTTGANAPPTPYYIRGAGTQYKSHNDGSSERLGTKFHVDKVPYGARISNRASYAKYVIGNEQAKALAKIGWKSLPTFAKSKIAEIKKVFNGWIKKAIKDAGL